MKNISYEVQAVHYRSHYNAARCSLASIETLLDNAIKLLEAGEVNGCLKTMRLAREEARKGLNT